MTIKELTAADIPALRDLAIRIYRDTFTDQNSAESMEAFLERDYSTESFQKEFTEPGSRYFFISDGETHAGYLRVRRSTEVDHLLGTNNIELHRLYIDKPYHGQRVGHELMQLAMDIATEGQYEWIWLGVWEHNPRAQRFYQKWGFEKFSEHIFHMGEEKQTDWLLRRRLR
jgi:ribosomal protein S18 acetylase RimI-like enzyme